MLHAGKHSTGVRALSNAKASCAMFQNARIHLPQACSTHESNIQGSVNIPRASDEERISDFRHRDQALLIRRTRL